MAHLSNDHPPSLVFAIQHPPQKKMAVSSPIPSGDVPKGKKAKEVYRKEKGICPVSRFFIFHSLTHKYKLSKPLFLQHELQDSSRLHSTFDLIR